MLRRISFIILGLLIAGLLAAGWYAYNKGFTQKWRKFVVQEFHKRGVELSLSKLTLEPFRGIVAKQVRIYDSRDRKRVIAVVDEVRLVVNYANLFQGRAHIIRVRTQLRREQEQDNTCREKLHPPRDKRTTCRMQPVS